MVLDRRDLPDRYDHMSYRANRLPWARHRASLVAAAWIVFLVAAAGRARKMRTHHSMPADRAH